MKLLSFVSILILSFLLSCKIKEDKRLDIKSLETHLKSYLKTEDQKLQLVLEKANKIENSNDPIKIRWGYYFGQCEGYCKTELMISSKGIKKLSSTWNINKKKRNNDPVIKIIEYTEMEYDSLIKLINFKELEKVNQIYGCPDCRDQGGEWLEIKKEEKVKRISMEYGAKIKHLDKLLSRIREIHE